MGTPSPSATTATSGEAAALTGDYALVLLDLTLPGKDGLEVLRARSARGCPSCR